MKVSALVAFGLLISVFSYSVTITVDDDGPADCNNIQAAIDAAVNGDIVVVADGLYMGEGNRDINFLGKAITVKSENGPTHCIIDVSDEVTSHRGFIFNSMETSTSVLEGFTLTGGYITESNPTILGGAGVLCLLSNPSIRNCIFYNNVTDGAGAAIGFLGTCAELPVLEVKNSTFYGNVASYGGVSSIQGTYLNEINFANCIFKNNIATESAETNNFELRIIAKCGPVLTTVDFSILDADWWDINNSIVSDPLFADPNNGDFHVKSTTGRWDPNSSAWVVDDVMSPAIDLGDPADTSWTLEPTPNAKRINAGAYGGTPEASMSELLCHSELASCYDDWVAFGMPDCWCYQKQCHGDADGLYQGCAKCDFIYVYTDDLTILANAWNIKEPPAGPGIQSIPSGICADFDHAAQGNSKTGYVRVYTNDLTVLSTYYAIIEPPKGPGVPLCPLTSEGGDIVYYKYPPAP